MADQGWLGIHLPESCGGLGLGTVELAVVAEEMGRACFPGPFLGTVWAATLVAEANPKSSHLEPLATGEAKGAVALLEPDTGWDAERSAAQSRARWQGLQAHRPQVVRASTRRRPT